MGPAIRMLLPDVDRLPVSAKSPPARRTLRRTGITAALFAALAASAHATGPQRIRTTPPGAVLITPDMNIQAQVDAHPANTVYFLVAGLYRLQQIVPKDGDRFIGAFGARLNGARLLEGARRSGSGYVFDNQVPDPHALRWGYCQTGSPRCDRPEALFVQDRPLRAVARLADLRAGTWFFDYDAKRIYVAEELADQTVELTDRPFAFGGSARDVWIENLIVEKYASADQHGAINDSGGGAGWNILDNEVRLNYGYGMTLASGHRAIGNFVHDNGELGIGGGNSANLLVEDNEIAFNAWNGTDCDWECGGAKWGAVQDITVRDNYVHNNAGVGLWTDVGCRNVLFEDNRVENNDLAGISHEISNTAIIRRNTLRGNGATTFIWGWHAQIQIQNSSDTQVYSNRVELDPVRGGNGIVLIQQDRGNGFELRNVFVHDNIVVMQNGHGTMAGWFSDFQPETYPKNNNIFRNNQYVSVLPPSTERWFANVPVSFQDWQATGADQDGSVTDR